MWQVRGKKQIPRRKETTSHIHTHTLTHRLKDSKLNVMAKNAKNQQTNAHKHFCCSLPSFQIPSSRLSLLLLWLNAHSVFAGHVFPMVFAPTALPFKNAQKLAPGKHTKKRAEKNKLLKRKTQHCSCCVYLIFTHRFWAILLLDFRLALAISLHFRPFLSFFVEYFLFFHRVGCEFVRFDFEIGRTISEWLQKTQRQWARDMIC